jgi:hypothetical protein
MLVGYMRVSTTDERQSVDLQRDALLAAGVDERHLHQDRASGARDDRPGLKACLSDLRAGDVLVVWKLDRLGAVAVAPHPHRGGAQGARRGVSARSPRRSTPPRRTGRSCSDSLARSPSTNGHSLPSASPLARGRSTPAREKGRAPAYRRHRTAGTDRGGPPGGRQQGRRVPHLPGAKVYAPRHSGEVGWTGAGGKVEARAGADAGVSAAPRQAKRARANAGEARVLGARKHG